MKLEFEQLQAMVDAVPDPLFVLTESGRYAGVYGGRDDGHYHDGSCLVGRYIQDVLPAEKAGWILEKVARSLDEGVLHTVEYGLSSREVSGLEGADGPDGEIRFEGRIHPLPFRLDGERAVVWTARNITRRYRLQEQLRRQTERDELTGVYNRRKLMEALEERFREFLRYGEPCALLMLDLDHFKRVNDRHGHLSGDDVLRTVAEACADRLRDLDIFARFGGEEFIALLPHTDIRDAHYTAERLRESVAALEVEADGEAVPLTLSVGVSVLLESDSRFDAVIARSDQALYDAKRAGRNCVVVAADHEVS